MTPREAAQLAVLLLGKARSTELTRGVLGLPDCPHHACIFAPDRDKARITQELAAATIEILGTGQDGRNHFFTMVVNSADAGRLNAIVMGE